MLRIYFLVLNRLPTQLSAYTKHYSQYLFRQTLLTEPSTLNRTQHAQIFSSLNGTSRAVLFSRWLINSLIL